MEAARTSESDDNFYTKDGKIRVTPEEWAAAYAQILAEPHGWYNKSIAPVLGEVLRRTEGVTRLQIAEALADLEGIPELDPKLLDRVERTRKRIDQILSDLVVQTGKGPSARMSLNTSRFNELKLDQSGENSARGEARRFAQYRVNILHSFRVAALMRTLKTKFNLVGYELNVLGCILHSGHKGYKVMTTWGMNNFTLEAAKNLLTKLPEGILYEDKGAYFACDEILNAFGEHVLDYTAKEERIENPDGPYPLEILHPAPEPRPKPKPPTQSTQGIRVYHKARGLTVNDLPPDAASWSLARLHNECPWYLTVFPHRGPTGGAPDELIARIQKERFFAAQGSPTSRPKSKRERRAERKRDGGFAALQATLDTLEDTPLTSNEDPDADFEKYLAGQEKDL